MWFYTYVIVNAIDGRFYIGSRGSAVPPDEDKYWGCFSELGVRAEMWNGYPWVKHIVSIEDTRRVAYVIEYDLIASARGSVLLLNMLTTSKRRKRVRAKRTTRAESVEAVRALRERLRQEKIEAKIGGAEVVPDESD